MHRFASLAFLAVWSANAIALDGPNSACSCGVVNVDVAHTGTPTGQMKKANGGRSKFRRTDCSDLT
jgi:hypothetical protein